MFHKLNNLLCLTLLILCWVVNLSSAQVLDSKLTLNYTNTQLYKILDDISSLYGIDFSYSKENLKLDKTVTIKVVNESLNAVLKELFKDTDVVFSTIGNLVMLKKENIGKKRGVLKKFNIHGHLKDSINGEDLIGGTVQIKELGFGITTNTYGFYSIAAPPGEYTLIYSYIGYLPKTKSITLHQDINVNVELHQSSTALQEVTILASELSTSDIDVNSTSMSTNKLDIATINKIPAIAGEVDLLRALQFLPGVKNSGEASTNFSVRGGNLDQNMILLDEAPVYNPSHFLGIFSVFNADAIKDMQLYKGGIPAQYGGRLSSVLDIRMKEGNSKKFGVTGGLGTISSRLSVEGPIVKEKSSFIISGRYTYSDAITRSIKVFRETQTRFYFYDLNLKANYTLNNNNRLYISGFFGEDKNNLWGSFVKWGNSTGTVRWNHLFNSKLFSNITFLYSQYNYGITAGIVSPLKWNSKIQDFALKTDLTLYANHYNNLKFGFSSTHHTINPGTAEGGIAESQNLVLPQIQSLEHAVYVSNDQQLNDKLSVLYGIRYTMFQNIGKGTLYKYNQEHEVIDTIYRNRGINDFYGGLEPRLSLRYSLTENSSLKGGYNRIYQYMQLLSNSSFGLSAFDVWLSSSPNLKPQKTDQIALGYFQNFLNKKYEASVEVYYKHLYNQINYADHAQLLFNPNIEGTLRVGKGYAYGSEFLLKKNTGRLSGWVSYTYGKTRKIIPEINSGKEFNANYDQPHNLAIVASLQVSKRISFAGNWVYNTGRPFTLPVESYQYKNYQVPVYPAKNSVRLPDYHRLDFSATLNSKEKPGRKYSSSLVLSIINLYGRKNVLFVNISPPIGDSKSDKKLVAHQLSLFGVIPSLTYNFNF